MVTAEGEGSQLFVIRKLLEGSDGGEVIQVMGQGGRQHGRFRAFRTEKIHRTRRTAE